MNGQAKLQEQSDYTQSATVSTRRFIIYKVTNQINGKAYVGQTIVSLRERMLGHIRKANAGCPYSLSRAIIKYGADKFVFEEVCSCQSKEELNAKEKELIKELNTKVPAGYNMTDGGEGVFGFHPSDITRAKMGLAHKGNKYSLGVKHSDEWKANKSKQMMGNTHMVGRKLSDEHKAKVSKSLIGNKRMVGRKLSDEAIAKRTEKQRGMKRSEETRKRISAAVKGRKMTNEAKENMKKAWAIRKQKMAACVCTANEGRFAASPPPLTRIK